MKWLTLHIGGHKFRVDLVKRSKELAADEHGATDVTKCRIWIRANVNESSREDTFLHETLHATMRVAGIRGCEISEEQEERLVTAMTPILHRVLKDLGFKFPETPKPA